MTAITLKKLFSRRKLISCLLDCVSCSLFGLASQQSNGTADKQGANTIRNKNVVEKRMKRNPN